MNTLFGVNRRTAGRGPARWSADVDPRPADAISAGIGFVTEDRKSQGLFSDCRCARTSRWCTSANMPAAGIINRKAEDAAVSELMDELQIRARDAELEVKALSGGNQQKVVFAKWLAEPPKVLLLDEPTRGVDVGGKAEIYHTINRLAAAGTADRDGVLGAPGGAGDERPHPGDARGPAGGRFSTRRPRTRSRSWPPPPKG